MHVSRKLLTRISLLKSFLKKFFITIKFSNCGGNWGIFKGDNCEYLDLCAANPNSAESCNGNGQCLTLQAHALLTWNVEKDLAGVVYSTPWDKE